MKSTNHIRVAREYGPEVRDGEWNLLGPTAPVRQNAQTRSTPRNHHALGLR